MLAWDDTTERSIIFACGDLSDRSLVQLGLLVEGEARRSDRRIVYVSMPFTSASLGALRDTALLLRSAACHAAVIAYLDGVAFGPTLWLAYHCDLVFSSPSTSIGWLMCRRAADNEINTRATIAMIEDLVELRPWVEKRYFSRLVDSSIHGEQAEAAGLFLHDQRSPRDGNLSQSVFELSGIDGNKWHLPAT